MTESEFLEEKQKVLKSMSGTICFTREEAKSILEELERYRSIGTVEECCEAVEKQKAKTPYVWGDGYSDGKPVFDSVILQIMMELKGRRAAEGKKQVPTEEQGRLLKLPCEVGDTLFVIPTKENSLLKIAKMECIGFCIGKPNNTINLFPISRSESPVKLYQPDFSDFGKTVFSTCQEAENVLEQMKKKEG